MRKKILARVLALSLCAVAAMPAVGCGGSTGEKIDKNKTQVRVYHYNAGYGNKWVYELKKNFEELMKDEHFEDGKTGVQVLINGDMKARISADAWREEPFDVLFLENPDFFYEMMQDGVVAPLDDIMKVANPDDDNQKIEDKMTQQQRDAYTYNGKYYGIPHYAGHYGFIYNKDMFDKYNFYFAAEPDAAGNVFISETNTEKSLGPDGKTGMGADGIDYGADDGLPTTFEEFFLLCDEINANSIDPICWPGKYSHQHVVHMMDNLVANIEGAEQMNLNYTFNGTAKDLIVLDESDLENGELVTEEKDITYDNGDELSRQRGKYYAIDFVSKILTNTDYYNEQDSLDETLLHTTMQKKFLENGAINSNRQNAMLVDGVWWQMEADAVFERMTRQDAKWSKENRNFGWMPLPQPTQEDADAVASGEKKSVYLDYLNAVACIKSNTPSEGVKNASLEFLKYAYTDKALCDFTYTTGTTIGVEYLDKVDRTQLTPYEKTLIDYINKSDLVYQVSGNVQYAMNVKSFRPTNLYGSGTITGIVIGFTDKKYSKDMTAEKYFTGYQTWYDGLFA